MDRSPLRNPDKAIFAVRKVVQLHPPIYQRRGMACAVDMGKEQYLLTWEGVFNEDDRDLINEKSVKFNRRSKTFSTMDLEISKIKQAGSCSFISVDKGLQHGDALTVEIPGSDVTTNDVCAQSFVGRNKSLTINFKYNQKKGRHELVSFKGKDCAIEKSDVLGSPIISNKCVIGVVGEDDNRRIIPYFISRTELGHKSKDPSEDGSVEDQNIPVYPKDKNDVDDVDNKDSAGAIGQTTNNLTQLKSIISGKNKGGLEELKNAASEMGFTVSDNDRGGNCLFHALAEQLEIVKGISIKHEELRKTLVGYLAGNPKLEDGTDLFRLLNMDQQSRFGTWEAYLKHMERDGIWGDEMMIYAAANNYKTIINVLSFPDSRLVIPSLPECKIWLGHIRDRHFVSLLKAPVSQSQQSIKETQKEEHQELRDKQGELMSAADHVVHPTIYQTQEELTKDRGQLTMCEERPQHKQTSLSGLNSTKKSANWSSPQKNQIYPAAYKVNDSDTEPSEEIVRIGKFDQKDLPYLALDMLVTGKWRNIAVDLDVPVDELNCIDNSDEYEKCYKMWKTWIERNGDAASYKKLAEVLKDHELQIIRENYCLEGNHPPLQETVATSTSENVKQEKILDKDFMKIAKKIQGKRYRLGRVLGVGDSVLEQITAKDPGDILEQSYQILKKWHSTKGKCATFTALAKALRDRTVALKEVVEEFCLVK